MTVHTDKIEIRTQGNSQVIDITSNIAGIIRESGITDGVAHIFCAGSTGALTTTEFEPGTIKDMSEYFDRHIPPTPPGPAWGDYHHHATWHDDNGHSHLRASLIGPDITVPIRNGGIHHGTWQQVIFIDFDTCGRNRSLDVTLIGE
ncbi:MAG TPA: secondary thiamine-phosphate synthase enzyme YjbQ [bacterium]|jgi:secondary thiamine-phosphate synthase enzyme